VHHLLFLFFFLHGFSNLESFKPWTQESEALPAVVEASALVLATGSKVVEASNTALAIGSKAMDISAPTLATGSKVAEVSAPVLAIGSKVTIFDYDEEMKATGRAVGHGMIVSLAGGTLHGRIIEEGNVSVAISSIVPGSERVWLYEANDNSDPPMVRLGDALNSVTKWPLEAVKAA
jgi:hypothetical protein